MGKFAKIIRAYDPNDEDNMMEVKTIIDVNSKGMFITTLDKRDVEIIMSYGISLEANRAGRLGYFEANTLDDLIGKIQKVLLACLQYKVISEVPVIKYCIDTHCSYVVVPNVDEIYPTSDPKWIGKSFSDWRCGSANSMKTYWSTLSGAYLCIWCMPYIKKTVEYGNGKTREFYLKYVSDNGCNSMQWLADYSMRSSADGLSEVREIEGTEENAAFFVNLIKSICKINEQIHDILKQGRIDILINRQKLIEVNQ